MKNEKLNLSGSAEASAYGRISVLPEKQREELLLVLKERFLTNTARHPDLPWSEVQDRLQEHPEKMDALSRMESTGGEPDVLRKDQATGEILFADFSKESPAGRRSLCYDRAAREGRKANQPDSSAVEMAESMGIRLLSEAQYRDIQSVTSVDEKTSSWLDTPPEVRSLGGAIFGDRRYERIFIYHNGAESYYGVRGFRGILTV